MVLVYKAVICMTIHKGVRKEQSYIVAKVLYTEIQLVLI